MLILYANFTPCMHLIWQTSIALLFLYLLMQCTYVYISCPLSNKPKWRLMFLFTNFYYINSITYSEPFDYDHTADQTHQIVSPLSINKKYGFSQKSPKEKTKRKRKTFHSNNYKKKQKKENIRTESKSFSLSNIQSLNISLSLSPPLPTQQATN